MHLNPESLSFALLISDLGSIARAANILGMKQATLSRKLTALESRVGVRLFDRSTRGAVPTVSGAGFLNQARRIVADLDTLLTSSRAAASGEEEKLGVGFSTSLAAGGMRALILELIQTLPGVQLSGFERDRRHAGILAPGQKLTHGAAIGASCVRVANLASKEFEEADFGLVAGGGDERGKR